MSNLAYLIIVGIVVMSTLGGVAIGWFARSAFGSPKPTSQHKTMTLNARDWEDVAEALLVIPSMDGVREQIEDQLKDQQRKE